MSDALYRVIGDNNVNINDKAYIVSAVLKKGYNASYSTDCQYILYVPINEIKQTTGNYIITFNDYKKINTVSEKLVSDYQVNIINNQNNTLLISSYQLAKTIGRISITVIFMITIMFLFLTNLSTIKNQKHALSFLKVNSLDYTKIEFSHYIFLLIESVIILILYICIQFIYILIINYIYSINMSFSLNLFSAYRFIIVFMLIVHLPTIYTIHFNNPIKNLR
jgi:hypothetical protein